MFILEEFDLLSENFVDQKSAISKLVHANDVTVFAVSNLIYRITGVGITRRQDSIAISVRPDDCIKDIFLDKTACYCIISLQKGGLFNLICVCIYMCLYSDACTDIYVSLYEYIQTYTHT
jgi:hypothetical protein